MDHYHLMSLKIILHWLVRIFTWVRVIFSISFSSKIGMEFNLISFSLVWNKVPADLPTKFHVLQPLPSLWDPQKRAANVINPAFD